MFILGDSNNFGSEFTIHDSIRKENEVISSLFYVIAQNGYKEFRKVLFRISPF